MVHLGGSCIGIFPFRSAAWHNFGVCILKQIHTDGPKRVNTPLRISVAAEVLCKERAEVIRESPIDDRRPGSAHDLGLKCYIMLCESLDYGNQPMFLDNSKAPLTMGSCRLMSYDVMQHGPRCTAFADWTGASFIDQSEVFCMLAKFYQNSHLSVEQIQSDEFALRLRGPRCVKATPNLAVRVGNTQSACLTYGSKYRNTRRGGTYHINSESNTDKQI